jgi:hypothetical protein
MHKCLFAFTAALITSALVGEGISQTSAFTQLQKQGTRVITLGSRAGPVPGVPIGNQIRTY